MTERIRVGNVTVTVEGDECIVSHRTIPALKLRVPAKRVEAWFLRRLRDETLQPASASEAVVNES
jgi:hypothetical protein